MMLVLTSITFFSFLQAVKMLIGISLLLRQAYYCYRSGFSWGIRVKPGLCYFSVHTYPSRLVIVSGIPSFLQTALLLDVGFLKSLL